ncbi:MAG: Gfo/Idh/MocA family oxidoreductase, partial [Pseudomonadota bacterium]
MPDKLRIAVVGTGIGARHVDGLLANSDLFDISIICDLNADRAKALAARADARVETDFVNLLNDPALDII